MSRIPCKILSFQKGISPQPFAELNSNFQRKLKLLLYDIKDHLEPFTLHRQDHPTDRFCSLIVCIKNNIDINEYEYFPGINAVKYVVVNNANQSSISLLLSYKKHNFNIIQYVEGLQCIINHHDINIILGDFNINFFNDNEMKPLNDTMNSSNYTQLV